MSTLGIIRGFPHRTENKGSFVNAHEDLLAGSKVVLDGYYPGYTFEGRNIQYFFSTTPWREKLKRLLPYVLYHRVVEQHRNSPERVHDALQAFFQTHDVDVVLAEFGNVGADICAHTRDMGIPLIVHFHGHDAHRSSVIAEYREKYQQMFEAAFQIITVSQYMTDALIALGAHPDKITLNPYGPQENFFDNESTFEEIIVGVGRFTDIKAPHLTLLAFQKVLKACPNATLIMGGHGELLEACQTLATTLGIADRVQLTGALRHDDVIRVFGKARCFVQHSVIPSYGDAEGTPVAILEAQAAGLPVVATRHAGIVDAVVDGTTGYLVDERDVDGMAERLIALLKDRQAAIEMGHNARKHIRNKYSIGRHIACIDRVIAQARESR